MLQYTVTTPPAVEPLSLAEAKSHLRVDGDADDSFITDLIVSAREYVETHTRRALINQTVTAYMRDWPDHYQLKLPKPPLSSVTSVKYYDADNVQQTLSSSLYYVFKPSKDSLGRVEIIDDWPTTYDRPDAIEIIYVAGYGSTSASVPSQAKHAMRLLIGHWYENREQVVAGTIATSLPTGVDALLYQLCLGDIT